MAAATPFLLDPDKPGSSVVGVDLSLTGTGIAALDIRTGALSTAVHSSVVPAADALGAHVNRHRDLVDGVVAQILAADPALVVVEDLQFSVKEKDSSLTRRGFLWWAVIEGLCRGGAPVTTVAPQLIKQLATGKGNAGKAEVVAAYAVAWPDAARGKNIEDRADASFAAALGAARVNCDILPFRLTVKQRKAVQSVGAPSIPSRIAAHVAACSTAATELVGGAH